MPTMATPLGLRDRPSRRYRLADPSARRLVGNLSVLGLSQLAIRISRIACILVLTRLLTPSDFGAAALVLTSYELLAVFTRNGIAAAVVKADEAEVEAVAHTAYWMIWIVCAALCVVQIALALPMAMAFERPDLASPIGLMGLVYLVTPPCSMQSAFLQRENRFGVPALAAGLQVVTDNGLSAILAFAGCGLWAIVLPKLLVAPIWLVVNRYSHPWRPTGRPTLAGWRGIARFGGPILGVELLRTVQSNVDTVIVGLFLGVDAVGIYYFAFNAGSGITLGLVNAFSGAIFAHLCGGTRDQENLRRRYRQSIGMMAGLMVPAILLQALLAPWYVPIVFGTRWTEAVPILIIICLSVVPAPFTTVTSQLARAASRPALDLLWQGLTTATLLVGLCLGTRFGIEGVATTVLVTQCAIGLLFNLSVHRSIFGQR